MKKIALLFVLLLTIQFSWGQISKKVSVKKEVSRKIVGTSTNKEVKLDFSKIRRLKNIEIVTTNRLLTQGGHYYVYEGDFSDVENYIKYAKAKTQNKVQNCGEDCFLGSSGACFCKMESEPLPPLVLIEDDDCCDLILPIQPTSPDATPGNGEIIIHTEGKTYSAQVNKEALSKINKIQQNKARNTTDCPCSDSCIGESSGMHICVGETNNPFMRGTKARGTKAINQMKKKN